MGKKKRERDDEEDDFEPPPPSVHVLTVPDELLEWVKRDDIAKTMPEPWGRIADRMIGTDRQVPLTTDETESLLSCLDAIVAAALRAGRQDLLLGFDTCTASLLKLTFSFLSGDKTISIGRGQRWTFEEVALAQATDDPPGARAFVERVKDLVEGIFPGEVGAITHGVLPKPCRGCGDDPVVVVESDDAELDLCLKCWVGMFGRSSTVAAPKKKARGKKKMEQKTEPETAPVETDDQLDLLGDRDFE